MYKTLPNEDEEQRKARLQKEFRDSQKKLIETNPFINEASIIKSIISSTAIEGVHIKPEEIIPGGLPELTKADLSEKRNSPFGKLSLKFKKKGRR